MHMSDALLSPATAVTMYALSGAAAGVSVKKLSQDEKAMEKLPVMGVMSAMVFAGQMINYTIPGTGSSGHLCGGMLLSGILGPYAGFLSMIAVLMIQAFFFADGGLLALGANVWNMAFYGCFLGYFLIYRPILHSKLFGDGLKKAMPKKLTLASILGCVITLQFGAFSVSIETLASGITELPFGTFVSLMQPIHLAIGLVEGLITATVLVFIYENRPEMLEMTKDGKESWTKKKMYTVLGIITALVGGILSLFASKHPDGLEWTIAKVTDAELESSTKLQKITSFLPDYSFSNGAAIGTSVSGIVGALILVAIALIVYGVAMTVRKKKSNA